MMHLTQNRVVARSRVLALSVLLAALLATLLSAASTAGAATPSGKAFSWGSNYHGNLGNGTSGLGTDRNVPVAVKNLTGVKSVKAGGSHGLALLKDGSVWAWGANGSGQLGNGTIEASNVPVKVKNLSGVKAISAGYDHNLALKENGSVWAWGSNQYGQLGIGTSGAYNIRSTPIQVGTLGTGVKGIAAGSSFSLALMTDGTVNSWGYNEHGQLGNGTETSSSTPVAVTSLTTVKAIATDSSASHVLALLEDGTVKSWGLNQYGELGDGTTSYEQTTPVAVANLTNVTRIATGRSHSLALLRSGNVKSWGYNQYGQLGNGTSGPNANRNTPGDVIGLTNVKSISGGALHSLAVLQSGRVRSWGFNYYGELGNGTTGTDWNIPGAVKNLSDVKNIDGGNQFTLAAKR